MSMKIGDAMPSFDGATGWLNSEATLQTGKPALVHFWAVSCGICKDKMPQLRELIADYGKRGLQAVAVHMPRYEADSDLAAVKEAVTANSITEPCAVDNAHKLKDAFLNEQGWVPVYYLFDADGKLKARAAGEYGLGIVTTALEKMFADNPDRSQSAGAQQ
jgi:thiol-disulfide isomerase/thioredoxin